MFIQHIKTSKILLRSALTTTKLLSRFISNQHNLKTEMGDSGVSLSAIIERLEQFASTKTAEGWDNVGLLVDPMEPKPIQKVLLTNDLTEAVVSEALAKKVGMIISYHPPIFKGLKTLNTTSWKERIIIQCIRNGIAVFSPHTSWDVAKGGVNDWLADSFNFSSSEPLTESGAGRLCKLQENISLGKAAERVKKHTGLKDVQLAIAVGKNIDSPISSIALCAGSGSSVLTGIPADLYLTGELSHHEVLDSVHRGTSVILTRHSSSERGFLEVFAGRLRGWLPLEVLVSSSDVEPLVTV